MTSEVAPEDLSFLTFFGVASVTSAGAELPELASVPEVSLLVEPSSLVAPDAGVVVDGEVMLPFVSAPYPCANAMEDIDAITTNNIEPSVVFSAMNNS